jgi:hypothetical protein
MPFGQVERAAGFRKYATISAQRPMSGSDKAHVTEHEIEATRLRDRGSRIVRSLHDKRARRPDEFLCQARAPSRWREQKSDRPRPRRLSKGQAVATEMALQMEYASSIDRP